MIGYNLYHMCLGTQTPWDPSPRVVNLRLDKSGRKFKWTGPGRAVQAPKFCGPGRFSATIFCNNNLQQKSPVSHRRSLVHGSRKSNCGFSLSLFIEQKQETLNFIKGSQKYSFHPVSTWRIQCHQDLVNNKIIA